MMGAAQAASLEQELERTLRESVLASTQENQEMSFLATRLVESLVASDQIYLMFELNQGLIQHQIYYTEMV